MDVYDVKARSFIEDHQNKSSKYYSEKPFFLYYAPYSFHYPMEAPQRYHNRCKNNVNFSDSNPERFAMCAMVLAVDDAIARLMKMLVEMERKSVVIISSDNAGSAWKGYVANNNWPLRGNKGEPFEGGVRNHALVWSNHAEFANAPSSYHSSRGFMHLVDWHATLANLGHGTDHSQGYETKMSITMGSSLWNTLRLSSVPSPRKWMYNSWKGESFRLGKYKLYKNVDVGYEHEDRKGNFIGKIYGHHWPVRTNQSHDYLVHQRQVQQIGDLRTEPWMLFDVVEDPTEKNDLIDTALGIKKKEEILEMWEQVKSKGYFSEDAQRQGEADGTEVAETIENFQTRNRCSDQEHTDYHTRIGVDSPGQNGTQSNKALLPGDLLTKSRRLGQSVGNLDTT